MRLATRSSKGLIQKTFFLSLALTGCTAAQYRNFPDLLAHHPATQLKNWQDFLDHRPNRGQLPPDFVQPATSLPLSYAIDTNRLDGFPAPVPAQISPERLRSIRQSLQATLQYQPEIRQFLNRRVMGLYLVDNLGSSGLTGIVYDSDGKAQGGFILMDASRIELTAEGLINLREKTIIEDAAALPESWGYRLDHPSNGPVPTAVDYLLLHEAAHVASEVYELLPPLTMDKASYRPPARGTYSFLDAAWLDPWNTKAALPFRKKLHFYAKRTFSAIEHGQATVAAQASGFPGLYATVDAWEHLAETVAYSMLLPHRLVFRDANGIDHRPVAQAWELQYVARLKALMASDPGPRYQAK
ncbi:MAG: hypothetical protein KDK37_17400 [Leptospiraceae bacterium]|nr:hypothetical protein [Leptospiraceae bacterium]